MHAAVVREFLYQVVASALIRAVCLDTRDCCLKKNRRSNSGCWQLEAVEAGQNSFGGRFCGAEDGVLDAPWVPASAAAIPALVCRFAANSRSDSALSCNKRGHMREYPEYFLRSRVLSNSEST